MNRMCTHVRPTVRHRRRSRQGGRIPARSRDRRPARRRAGAGDAPERRRPAAAVHRRPRHPRVGRLDRARARARGPFRRARQITTRRRHPDAGDRLRHARDGLRRRARDLAPRTIRSRTTASRCSRAGARSSPRRSSARSRRSSPTRAGACRRRADVPVDRTDVIDAYIAHARLALPDPQRLGRVQARHRHGERRDDDRRAAAVPRAGLRRRAS